MRTVWGHDGCGTYWAIKLTSCPRHPGEKLKETEMPKITRYGGHSIAGITDTATGQTETGSGFTDDTEGTQLKAAARASDDPTGEGYDDQGQAIGGEPPADGGLVAGGDDAPEDPAQEPPFDPGELSVVDVQALLESASPAEREAVINAERGGKNRKGITGDA